MKWSNSQVRTLIAQYPRLGLDVALPFTRSAIQHKATRLGLRVSKSRKAFVCSKNSSRSSQKKGIDPHKIINVSCPKVAYFLGFFWADGWISRGLKRSNKYRISMEITKSDAVDVMEVMMSIGSWSVFTRSRKRRKPQTAFVSSGRAVVECLVSRGYGSKSGGSARLAVESIPPRLRRYWLRGYFDGDGCIYINNKNYSIQVSFCGTYSQDWKWLVSWLSSVGINSRVARRRKVTKSGKVHRHSALRVTDRTGVLRFCEIIYGSDHTIGLSRKRKKFSLIPDAKRNVTPEIISLQRFCRRLR